MGGSCVRTRVGKKFSAIPHRNFSQGIWIKSLRGSQGQESSGKCIRNILSNSAFTCSQSWKSTWRHEVLAALSAPSAWEVVACNAPFPPPSPPRGLRRRVRQGRTLLLFCFSQLHVMETVDEPTIRCARRQTACPLAKASERFALCGSAVSL